MVTKARLYDLIDALPEDVWPDAELALSHLAIPVDDEELTPQALARIEESRAAADRGEVIPDEELDHFLAELP